MDVWQQVKLHYIGLLIDHHQPECAETFFNSVTTKILHRSYFHNDFIFVRPAVSTEYIENDEPAALPTYRAYYPTRDDAGRDLARASSPTSSCEREFEDLGRDVDARDARPSTRSSASSGCGRTSRSRCCRRCSSATRAPTSSARSSTASPRRRSRCRSCTTSAASSHRRGAVRRGRPAAAVQLRARLLHGRHGGAVGLRAVPALADAEQAALRALQRARPAEAGQDASSTATSCCTCATRRDQFRIAPGIKGMVMLVFDLPSLPLRVQGDQGLLSRRRRTPRASRSRASTCW